MNTPFQLIYVLVNELVFISLQHTVQEDRDDPGQPLVTAPFGHASQVLIDQTQLDDCGFCHLLGLY